MSLVITGLQCDDFNATVFRLALDSVIPNATFSDEVCTDAATSAISVMNEVTVPLVVVSKFDVVNVHEYVTSVLNRSVSEGTLTVAIVAFAQRRLEEGNGGSSLRRLDAGGMAAASVEVRFAGALL